MWLATSTSDADDAIVVLSQVIEADSKRAGAFAQRGWRYQQQNKMELAYPDYLAAAELGDAWSEMMTGKFLWAGTGVKQNRDEALIWLRKAANQGQADAKLSLKQALEQNEKK